MAARLILLVALALGVARAQIGWEVEFGKIYCGYLQANGSFKAVGGREDLMQGDKVWRWTLDDTDSTPANPVRDCSGKCAGTDKFCVEDAECDGDTTCEKGTLPPAPGKHPKYAGILEFKTAAVKSDTASKTVMEPLDTSLKTIYQMRTEMKEIYIRVLEARKNHPNCQDRATRATASACLVYDTPFGALDRGNEAAIEDTVTKKDTTGKWICSLKCDSGIKLFDTQSFQVTSNVKLGLLAGTDDDVTSSGANHEYALLMTKMPHSKCSLGEVTNLVKAAEEKGLIPGTTDKAEFTRYLGIWWSYAGYEQSDNPDKNRTPYYKDGMWYKVLTFERVFGDAGNRAKLQQICKGELNLKMCFFTDTGIAEEDEPKYSVVEERLAQSSCAKAADPHADDAKLHMKKCYEQLHAAGLATVGGAGAGFKAGTRNALLDEDAADYMANAPATAAAVTTDYDAERNERIAQAKKYESESSRVRAGLRQVDTQQTLQPAESPKCTKCKQCTAKTGRKNKYNRFDGAVGACTSMASGVTDCTQHNICEAAVFRRRLRRL